MDRRRKGGNRFTDNYWLSNYIVKEVKIRDENSISDLMMKYRRDGYITNVMKYINIDTMTMATDTYCEAYNGRNIVVKKCKDKSPGVDDITCSMFNENKTQNIAGIVQALKDKTYKVNATRRVYIPKGQTNKLRPLSIMCYKDQLIQMTMVNQIIEPLMEEYLSDFIFSYRFKRGVESAVRYIEDICYTNNIGYALKIDIKSYFDNINIDKLLEMLNRIVKDKTFIGILREVLHSECWTSKKQLIKKAKSEIVEEDTLKSSIKEINAKYKNGIYSTTRKGIQQGAVVAPYLANFYMDNVIGKWIHTIETNRSIYPVIYGDDVIILGNNIEDIILVKEKVKDRLEEYELTLSEEKTSIIDIKKDNIEFLGYELEVKDYEVIRRVSNSKVEKDRYEIDSLINRSSKDYYEDILNRGIYGTVYEWKFYYQDYIWWLNDTLVGKYRYYSTCENGSCVSDQLYDYAYTIVERLWSNSMSRTDLDYMLEHIISPLEYKIRKCRNRR